jgi:hypothetical protein
MRFQGWCYLAMAWGIALAAAGCRSAEMRLEHPPTGVRVTCRWDYIEPETKVTLAPTQPIH